MATCTADNVSIDCPRGCAVICLTDGSECWAMCGSEIMVLAHDRMKNLPPKTKLEFQCRNITLSSLSKGLAKILPKKPTVPRGKTTTKVTKTMIGTLGEIVREIGLYEAPQDGQGR